MRRVQRAVPPGGGVYVAGDLLDLAVASVARLRARRRLHAARRHRVLLRPRRQARSDRPRLHRLLAADVRRAAGASASPGRHDLPSAVRHSAAGARAARRLRDRSGRSMRAGSSTSRRGCSISRKSIASCCARGIEVQWTIAGAGPDEAELRAPVGIQPAGAVARPPDHAGAARPATSTQDVFVLPTRFEGFPVALVEAMGAGLVPVVSDIESGVPEIVDDGHSGECPPTGDVTAFADAIARLDGDRPRLEAMSAAARQTVEDRFDIRDRVTDYQALYARWEELYRPVAGAAAPAVRQPPRSAHGFRTRSCAWSAPRCERRDDSRASSARSSASSSPPTTARHTSPRRSRACWRRRWTISS